MTDRLAEQLAVVQRACVNLTADWANLSSLGVALCGSP